MAMKGKGGRGGPGGFVLSILVLLVVGGALFAFAKANNLTNAGAIIDWTRTSSDKLQSCLQPDVKFWTCSFDGQPPKAPGTGDSDSGSTPGTPDSNGGSGEGSTPGADTGSEQPSATDAMLQKLATLKVGDPQSVDYDRSQWKHWIGDRCDDTRQQVLKDQAKSFQLDGQGCRVVSGEWIDPYTGQTFTDPAKLDIDHVYALGAAAKNGGNGWDSARKQAFANDRDHLYAVSASANRSKSDKNPAEWWPENAGFSCEFATTYVNIAAKYELQFSKADVAALEKGLKTCG